MTYVYVIAGVIAVLCIIWFGLRFGARKWQMPCPAAFAWLLGPGSEGRPARRVRRVVDELDLSEGMHVLDVGCGPGLITVPVARAVGPAGSVTALDVQQAMLDRMKKRVDRAGLSNVESIHAGAGDATLGSGRFDRAVLSAVLGEIPDRNRALQEIYEALKPGGFLLVAELIGDPHYQRKSTVREMAEGAGFGVGEPVRGLLGYSVRLYRP